MRQIMLDNRFKGLEILEGPSANPLGRDLGTARGRSSTAPCSSLKAKRTVTRSGALGALATTNPGGANKNKWRKEFSRALQNRHVIVLADNDEPGRHRAVELPEQRLSSRFRKRPLGGV